jgi:GDP-4-dehydro-6-deoxy-D-mannose reductase
VRIFVTGSSGFAGRHMCRYLKAIGDEVIEAPGLEGPAALDVTDAEAVCARIAEARPEGVIHLAGVSSVAWSHANPIRTFHVNTVGAVNLLQGAREFAPDARFLLVGSGEMYGRLLDGRRAREDDQLRPLSPYSASKCAAEIIAKQFSESYGLHVICARPFNHAGAGQDRHFVIPSFARQIANIALGKAPAVVEVGDLSPVRDFLHVQDVVRGYRLLLERGISASAYNLCSEQPVSIREILETLQRLAGVQLEVRADPSLFRPAEIPWLVGDGTRIRALGWAPTLTLTDALSEAYDSALRE